jgi:hypothetical protein
MKAYRDNVDETSSSLISIGVVSKVGPRNNKGQTEATSRIGFRYSFYIEENTDNITIQQYLIHKATPTITLSGTSASVNYNSTGSFTATPSVAGRLTALSDNTTYVTVTSGANNSASANTAYTVSYKGVKARSSTTKITVTLVPTDQANYNTISQTFGVIVNKIDATCTLTISGTAKVGNTLTANVTTNSDGEIQYTWGYANTTTGGSFTVISGATSRTYKIPSTYAGKYICCDVRIREGTNWKARTTQTLKWTSKVSQ